MTYQPGPPPPLNIRHRLTGARPDTIDFPGACPHLGCRGALIAYPSRWMPGRYAVDCRLVPWHDTGHGFVTRPEAGAA
jgi:hypothetical protein